MRKVVRPWPRSLPIALVLTALLGPAARAQPADSAPPPPADPPPADPPPPPPPAERPPSTAEVTERDLAARSLEELMQITVVTSSRSEERRDAAPNVMYVITAEQIRKMGYRSIMDLLDSIPGFEYCPSVNLVHPIVRGIQSLEYLTFMVNGHIIDNILETNWMYGALPLDAVDHLEIIVGPGGVFYPAETGTAIINLVTKTDGTNVAMAGGTRGYLAGSFAVGGNLGPRGHWEVMGYGSQMGGRAGYVPDDASAVNRMLRDKEIVGKYFPSYSIIATAGYDDWSLQFVHLNQDQTYGQGYQDGALEAHRWDYVDSFGLKNVHDFGGGFSTEFSGAMDNKRYARVGTVGPPIFQLDFSQHVYSGDAAAIYRTDHHLLRAGVQAQHREHRHFYTLSWQPGSHDIDFGDGKTFANDAVLIAPTHGLGAYLSEKWSPLPQLDAVAAIRGDYDTVFNKADRKVFFSPRAALVYTPTERLILKLLYNTSVRMPNAFYGSRNLQWGDNATGPRDQWYDTNDLAHKPSVLRSAELQGIFYAGPVRVSANVYRQDLKDFLAWNNPFTNTGNFHSWGMESSAQLRLADKLDVNVGFMWLIKNQFVTTSRVIVPGGNQPGGNGQGGFNIFGNSKGENLGSAKVHLYAAVIYELLDFASLSAAFRFEARDPYARLRFDPSNPMGTLEEGYTNSPFVDLGISKDDIFHHGIFFGVFARNLLNQHHFIGAVEGQFVEEPEGFSLMAKAGKSF